MQKVKSVVGVVKLPAQCASAVSAPPPASTSATTLVKMADYIEVPYQHSGEGSGEYMHAAHVMIYAPWPGALFGKYQHKYAVMVSEKSADKLVFDKTPNQGHSACLHNYCEFNH